jgi:hypothetical protein
MAIIDQNKIDALISKVDRIYTAIITNKDQTSTVVNGYISEEEASKKLGRSKTWFWRKRTEGIIPFKKMGSKVYYKNEDLFNLIKES